MTTAERVEYIMMRYELSNRRLPLLCNRSNAFIRMYVNKKKGAIITDLNAVSATRPGNVQSSPDERIIRAVEMSMEKTILHHKEHRKQYRKRAPASGQDLPSAWFLSVVQDKEAYTMSGKELKGAEEGKLVVCLLMLPLGC